MNPPRFVSIVALGLTLYALPSATLAQQPAKAYRIGVLSSTGPEQENLVWADLRGLLRERGWVEGQNLVLEWRYAEGKYERLPALAAELVRLEPDLIMARGGPGTTAAKRATATIPIVMYGTTDPVGIGVVQSLARPGGNVTGLADDQDPEILGKQLQLLKDVAPAVSKVAFLTTWPTCPSAGSTGGRSSTSRPDTGCRQCTCTEPMPSTAASWHTERTSERCRAASPSTWTRS